MLTHLNTQETGGAIINPSSFVLHYVMVFRLVYVPRSQNWCLLLVVVYSMHCDVSVSVKKQLHDYIYHNALWPKVLVGGDYWCEHRFLYLSAELVRFIVHFY